MSDWDTVTVLKKRQPKASTMKSEQAVNAARRQGIAVETQQKWGAGSNKQHVATKNTCSPISVDVITSNNLLGGAGSNKQHVATKNTAKLDRETEELKHERISLDIGRLIQQGRQAKNLSQKDLATKINEKPQVITDYEAGRGIPNNVIIGKIERVIGIKLRGKDLGKAVLPPMDKQ
ncbi:helix-turn-helix protein [Popillia japonica]|uniref:Helix-turn-helix protein n=1 Tax=Popillia japonica TaxID=7064 RepID=A0AAW1MH32_POPJA